MASVVGKTIFSDGKGKLFFGYYKDNDAVEFVDYKTWKKLSFKDVSKGDTNKERVIKAILKNQKQFNKKVDFNMWAKQKKRTFEETMDWFIQNGWINNINKGGIKESVDILSVTEGKKRFNTKYGVGKSKYVINYHDGKKKHKDGSDFFDIQIFKNQKDLDTFKKALLSKGFVQEGVTEAKFGYKDSTASYIKKHNNEYKIAEKMNKGNERKFYDDLQVMEDKIGHSKTMLFISNALRGYGVDMFKDPKIKNPADAQEALFLLSK